MQTFLFGSPPVKGKHILAYSGEYEIEIVLATNPARVTVCGAQSLKHHFTPCGSDRYYSDGRTAQTVKMQFNATYTVRAY